MKHSSILNDMEATYNVVIHLCTHVLRAAIADAVCQQTYGNLMFSFFIHMGIFVYSHAHLSTQCNKITYFIQSFLFTSDTLHGKFFRYEISEDTDLVYGNFDLCGLYCPKGTGGGFRRLD